MLAHHGYRVLTVPDLLTVSPFADMYNDHPCYPQTLALMDLGVCVAYRDNTVCPDNVCTRGELYMMISGQRAVLDSIEAHKPIAEREHPYSRAAVLSKARDTSWNSLELPLDGTALDDCCKESFGVPSGLSGHSLPRSEVISALAALMVSPV